MELALVFGSIAIGILAWKLARGGGSRDKPEDLSGDSAQKQPQLDLETAAPRQLALPTEAARLQALWRAGKIDSARARAILDRATQLGLTREMCDELKRIVNPTTHIQRCRVCGAPAIPGDDMCYAHHAN